jgi:hypothetical protein
MATINMGFITFSLIRLLIAFGFYKRQGSGSENTVAVKPAPNSVPPLPLCGPAFYLLLCASEMNEESKMTLYRSESALARESRIQNKHESAIRKAETRRKDLETHRGAPFITGIGPFKPFKWFAPFKSFEADASSNVQGSNSNGFTTRALSPAARRIYEP